MNKTEQKHTAEPWKIVDNSRDTKWQLCIDSSKGDFVAEIALESGCKTAYANAQRIVDCVNACEGVKNPHQLIKGAKLLDFEANKLRGECIRWLKSSQGINPEAVPLLLEACKAWVTYMDSDLSEAETVLLEQTKQAIDKSSAI